MPCKTKEEERQIKGKVMLCDIAARNIKKTIMKDVKETESDIASACAIFHKRHEQKTGKHITTISEFEKVTREFSNLSRSEMEKLITEGKEEEEEEDKKRHDIFKEMMKKHK